MPSMPKKYKFKENIPLNKLLDKIENIRVETLCYVISFDFKCIGVKIKTKHVGFIPYYPSAVKLDDDKKFVFIDDLSIWSSYQNTLISNEIKKHDKDIPCAPSYLLEESGKIVGIFTETNQFVQINPTIENNIAHNFKIDSVLNLVPKRLHNPNKIDSLVQYKSQSCPEFTGTQIKMRAKLFECVLIFMS